MYDVQEKNLGFLPSGVVSELSPDGWHARSVSLTAGRGEVQTEKNAVNNVLAGREDPETVKKMIITEYRGTQRDSTYSAEEIEINTQYQAFLTEAYSVLEVYAAGQAPDLKKMNAAKAKLS